jgi:predicted DNA-binding protein (MmcQ/YjbR family)
MQKYSKPKPDVARAEAAIAKLAASYPEVTEDKPWGHSAFKVKGKTFLFLYADGDGLSVSVKLPQSGKQALELGFTEPTHYGLGKSGWVSARVAAAKQLPLALVKEWLAESFRAIAPKKLSAQLAGERNAAAPSKRTAQRPSPSARSTSKPKAKLRARGAAKKG